MMKTLSPQQAAELFAQGATIVDIRSAEEYARKHIPGTKSVPIETLDKSALPQNAIVIFTCLGGMRTHSHVPNLQASACDCSEAYLLEGGLNAWEKAGLALNKDSSQPMELIRQVQVAAGSLVLLGVFLGAYVSPGFYFLAGFVGAGLVFAGFSGFCGMARLLMRMPWNRQNKLS